MTTTPWVNRNQIAAHKQISKSVYDEKLNQIILETQFQDILPIMGERFYNDFNEWINLLAQGTNNTHPSDEKYTKLYNGGIYEHLGITYTNYGLIPVLANYVYARYTMFGDIIDNPFGMVNKLQGEQSVPIGIKTKETLYKMNQNIAFNYWLNVRRFIIRNTKDFPLYQICTTNDLGKFKIHKIGSNNDRNKYRR